MLCGLLQAALVLALRALRLAIRDCVGCVDPWLFAVMGSVSMSAHGKAAGIGAGGRDCGNSKGIAVSSGIRGREPARARREQEPGRTRWRRRVAAIRG
jgi:hypothetical protein